MSKINEVNLLTSELTATTSEAAGADSTGSGNCSIDYGGGYVTTANLKIEPQVEWHYIESLQKKFEAVIRGYCDLNLLNNARQEEADPQDVRKLIKHVADIIWNTLSKAQYKDRPHLQSIYRYVLISHITYIDTLIHIFDNCLLFHDFPHLSCLGRPLVSRPAPAALRGKSLKETIFKIMAGSTNVSLSNQFEFTNLLILLSGFVYSYLTGNKLDCFGVAFAVVASCQLLEVPGNNQRVRLFLKITD